MNLSKLSDNEIETNLKDKAHEERKLTIEVISLLEEVDRRKIFLRRGFGSLIEYCVKELKYSESSAYRRISAMRVVRDVPEVARSIESGALNLMNVAQAQTYFKSEAKFKVIDAKEKRGLLAKLENKSARETEKIILELAPQSVPRESVRQVTANITRLTLILSEEAVAKLDKLKDLLSHKMPNASYGELIEEISNLALKRLDLLRTATPALVSSRPTQKRGRYVPTHIRRAVWQKSSGQCSYSDPSTGKRCESTRFLEIDHKKAFSKGGETAIGNLQLLCDAHNRWKSNDQ